MPQVIPWVVKIGTAIAAYFKAHAVVAFFAKLAAVYAIGRALTPKASFGSLKATATEVNVRDPAAPRQIIYGGPHRLSGVMYPVGTSGSNNEYLHICLLIAGHECEELGTVYFNDEEIPLDGSGNATGRFAGFVRIKKHRGTHNQTVDTDLQTDLGSSYWPNTMQGGGIAYLYIRLKVNAELFSGGLPEFWCLVKGRKLYDSRDGGQSATNAATWTWSNNAALCLNDWLRGVPTRNSGGTIVRNFGLGAADDEIDYTAVEAAANICEESVVLADASTEDRYTANGGILSSLRAGDGIDVLKSAMAGDCVPVGGLWTIYAGAYRSPTVTIDEGDLRGPLQGVRLKPSRKDICNVVRGIFVSVENAWQVADFPEVKNATYRTQDGGEELPLNIELQFTTSSATAQRIAKTILERSRQGISFVMRCKLTVFEVKAGDVVQVTNSRFGWSAKPFEVLATAFVVEDDGNGNPYLGVDLTLKETASGVWDWADGEETEIDLAPNTNLPDPSDVQDPTSLSVVSNSGTLGQQNDGTVIPRLYATWTAPADANVTQDGIIRVEFKPNASGTWLPWSTPRGDQTEEYVTDVIVGTSYDVRIRSENSLGVAGAWVTQTGVTAVGLAAPNPPTGVTLSTSAANMAKVPPRFVVSTGAKMSCIKVSWTPSTSLHVAYYEVAVADLLGGTPGPSDDVLVRVPGTEIEKYVYYGVTNTTVDVQVRAINRNGVAGSYSSSATGGVTQTYGTGNMAEQAKTAVDIQGGTISGITDLALADGGTGASSASSARTNLGLGSIATQAASSVSITGGSLTGLSGVVSLGDIVSGTKVEAPLLSFDQLLAGTGATRFEWTHAAGGSELKIGDLTAQHLILRRSSGGTVGLLMFNSSNILVASLTVDNSTGVGTLSLCDAGGSQTIFLDGSNGDITCSTINGSPP